MKESWNDLKIYRGQCRVNLTIRQAYNIFCAMHAHTGMKPVIAQIRSHLRERFENNPRLKKKYPGILI